MSATLLLVILGLFGHTPPVDDGPCPAGTTAVVPAGATYDHDVWRYGDGSLYGVSFEEDECILLALS